jgi:hypothetical protein
MSLVEKFQEADPDRQDEILEKIEQATGASA